MKPELGGEHFRQLAVLLNTGIDAHKALTLLRDQDTHLSPLLQPVINDLKRGSTLAATVTKSKLLQRNEAAILKLSEQAGQLPKALKFIATNLEKRQSQIGKLKAKLWLPFALLTIAIIAGALLDIARGLSIWDSVSSGIFMFVIVILITKYLLSLLKSDTFLWLSLGWRLGLHNQLPLYQRYFEFHWYNLFMWQIDAGIDYKNAFKALEDFLPTKTYQKSIQNCKNQVQQGQSTVLALTKNNLVFTDKMKQALQVGEQSGRWVDAVKHHLKIQKVQLEMTTNAIFEWIPRLFYILIICLALPRVF